MPPTDAQHEYRRREDVIRRLLQRELADLPLRSNRVKAEDRPLYVAAIRHFRTWRSALRAAGLDPESVAGRRTWTQDRVRRRIRHMADQLMPLSARAVRELDQPLIQAARKFYGSWDEALRAAGFDPTTIRRQRPPWTRSALIQAIQVHAARGGRLTTDAIRPRSIATAARRLFGSFDAALAAAGVLEKRPRPPAWSRAKVEAAIRRRRQAGQPVSSMAVIRTDPGLYDAARRYHGSWNEALQAVGLKPERVRAVRQPWTREAVIEELRRRVAAGVPPTCVSSIRPIPLVTACRRLFGSCEAAALAAGVDPTQIGYFRSPRHGLRRPGQQGGDDEPAR